MCAGQAGRVAGRTLTALQRAASPVLPPEDTVTLKLLAAIVACPGPRDIAVRSLPSQPTLIYSDASFEHGVLRVGWVIFGQSDSPQGLACVPDLGRPFATNLLWGNPLWSLGAMVSW